MAENMLSVVKYDAGGVEIKLEPETVKNYLVRGNGKVTDQEVLFFIRTCQAQKLNPLVYGEVYLIKFGNEPAQLVIGKETYMKRAFKNPNYNGMKSGIVVQRGEEIIQKEGTCLYPSETLLGGWCRVYHELNNKETETFKEVSLQEYQKFKDGKPMANWGSKPCTMIEKVAVGIIAKLDEKDIEKMRRELLEIAEDGKISPDEEDDFTAVSKELDKLAVSISELRLIKETVTASSVLISADTGCCFPRGHCSKQYRFFNCGAP